MNTYFATDYNPDLHKEIEHIYCPHKLSWLTAICYYQTDESNHRHPLLSVDGDYLYIRDVLATDQFIELNPLIESYAQHNDVVFISFNARMLKYISSMAQIKPQGIKILCANEYSTTEQIPHLIVDGENMEFFYQEITSDCFSFDDAIEWFKSKHKNVKVIEFSALVIRQLVELGKRISEGSRENNPF